MLVTDASVGRVLGGAQIVQEKNRESFLLSKNVCWCWLRMLLLAEYVPATMLDPKALGTAFDVKKNKKVRMELHILTFIEQCSGLQGRRRCLAAGVLDIWNGTDPPDHGTARHGTSLSGGQATIMIVFKNAVSRCSKVMRHTKHIILHCTGRVRELESKRLACICKAPK